MKPSEITWADLSADEQETLRKYRTCNFVSSDLSPDFDKLCRKGLVFSHPHHEDSMLVDFGITAEGRRVLATSEQPQAETPQAVGAEYTPVTQQEINDYLKSQGQDPTTLADAFRPAIEAAIRKQRSILGALVTPREPQPAAVEAVSGSAIDEKALNAMWEQSQMKDSLSHSYGVYIEQESDKGNKPARYGDWLVLVIGGMTKQVTGLQADLASANERARQAEAFAARVEAKARECEQLQMLAELNGPRIFSALQFGARSLRGLGMEASELLAGAKPESE